ncbi:RNaseH domain-containing protein [Micromonospora sp. NPDC048843]|uniref:RNaseH domain-containing protein n=1 Tax=Micromonospora sp. NPDC048843 TaxID=3155389 RepID=UPI0033C3B2DC
MAKISDRMQLTAFTLAPDARWDVHCKIAGFPKPWLDLLTREYHARPEIKPGFSLPTRSLVDLLLGIDPAVIHVNWNLASDRFIVAFADVDPAILTVAVGAWASTAVAPDSTTDWWDAFDPDDLRFNETPINALDHAERPNGTAAPSECMYDLLPTLLAQYVREHGLHLIGKPRESLLGPPSPNNHRSLVLLPFSEVPQTGGGLTTAKIEFHVETIPHRGLPSIHADLTSSRFPLQPVAYIPQRGDGPAGATILLHAPDGFLDERGAHTLLAAKAQHRYVKGGQKTWQWTPGLAGTLGRLTHLTFPAPEKVFADPRAAHEEGRIRAYILYSEGTKSDAEDFDVLEQFKPDENGKRKARSLRHGAKTGFVPADHMHVREQLANILEPLGIQPLPEARRVGTRPARHITPTHDIAETYALELWTQSDDTRQAILAALQLHHGLEPRPDPTDPATIHFTGDLNLAVHLREVGALGAGIERPDKDRSVATLRGSHANHVQNQIGPASQRAAAIFELHGPDYFARTRTIDPKPSLKKAFARSGRRLQCMKPAIRFKPPANPPTNPKKIPTPYPGTVFTKGTIHRASASVLDALRQLGRLGRPQLDEALAGMELVGIWLHHLDGACVPLVVRMPPEGEPAAHLATTSATPVPPMPYSDLPQALAAGKGRIPAGKNQQAILSRFLSNVLGVDETSVIDEHDRAVFVKAYGFRKWGWNWIQDKNIAVNRLVLPGHTFDDDQQPPSFLTPQQCPGLRIIRVRDRSTTQEVALGFPPDYDTHSPRGDGLYTFDDHVYYSINPRAEQMQTPLTATKIDPDVLANHRFRASNETPLEILPAFLQAADTPDAFADLTQLLRRSYLHTEQATLHPAPIHLCKLAAEYL